MRVSFYIGLFSVYLIRCFVSGGPVTTNFPENENISFTEGAIDTSSEVTAKETKSLITSSMPSVHTSFPDISYQRTPSAEIPVERTPSAEIPVERSPSIFTPVIHECKADGCEFLPCTNGGVCAKAEGKLCQWHCVCPPEWTGIHCDVPNDGLMKENSVSNLHLDVKVIKQSKSPAELLNILFQKLF